MALFFQIGPTASRATGAGNSGLRASSDTRCLETSRIRATSDTLTSSGMFGSSIARARSCHAWASTSTMDEASMPARFSDLEKTRSPTRIASSGAVPSTNIRTAIARGA